MVLSPLAWASWIGALLLCLLFVRALLHKLGDFAAFVADVANYRVLPAALAKPAAVIDIALEAATVILLCIAPLRAMGGALALLLLAGYAIAIAMNLHRGRTTIDCGCGGGGQGISKLHVLRNSVYALVCVPVIAAEAQAPHGVALFASIACVLALWLAMLLFDQLLGNRVHALATTHSRL